VIDWVSGKVLELTDLVRGASVLGAIVMVAFAYYKVRTLVAVLVAALTAGVFLWTINNVDWWQQRVQEETGTAETSRTGHLWDDAWDFQKNVSSGLDDLFAEVRTGLDNSELGND
jgi:hypothetical protein